MEKSRAIWSAVSVGAAVGLMASFLETIEYQILLKNSHAILTCNLNSVFSCTNVLNAWQSKVFGFPNSMLCMVFFTLMLGLGLVGATGGRITRGLRLAGQGIALFFLGFGLWFLEQSTFSVRALCILCVFCFAGLLTVNASFLRVNIADLPVSQSLRDLLRRSMVKGADIFGWIVFGLLITFVIALKFR